METNKILQSDFIDLLFNGRNQDYGAYELRKSYNKRVRNSILATFSISLLLVGGYVIASNSDLSNIDRSRKPVVVTTVLEHVEIPETVTPPPPPVQAPPPPAVATIAFTHPRIVDNDQVQPEEEMPPIESTDNKAIGIKTTDGVEGDFDPSANGLGPTAGGVETPPVEKKEEIYTFVEIMPSFPGGDQALHKFLNDKIVYPSMAAENGIEGTVFVTFVVDGDGNIKDFKTTGAVRGGGLEEEALRVVKKMPKWNPGKQNGKPVNVQFNLPIRFRLGN
ncbi:protein TonB [Chitinophaga skermanii]|uniref:Protein TonB n=1 Tax=Chitinophaga skermanii TaxID=331697 RepID=A0A327R4E2_9BACT|nr:energy transducer TonB [Chitinophaga skermanii]RAJ10928.1 protein TonB [Chitinophaga skermanii]